jgi:hypothetical protein
MQRCKKMQRNRFFVFGSLGRTDGVEPVVDRFVQPTTAGLASTT